MKPTIKILILFFSAILVMSSCKKDDPTYTLTITVNPEGAGTVTGAGVYKAGEIVALTVTPNSDYMFINWTIDGTEVSTELSFDYTTTEENVTIIANFEEKIIVTLGAQSNLTTGAFYSLDLDQVYDWDGALTVQDTIDLLCFYEHVEPDYINDITLSSPGANIRGIFPDDFADWTIKNTTRFCGDPLSTITVEQFDALRQNDSSIPTYYPEDDNYRKATNLEAGQIYSFKSWDGIYGLVKVISTSLSEDGSVTFELKLKK